MFGTENAQSKHKKRKYSTHNYFIPTAKCVIVIRSDINIYNALRTIGYNCERDVCEPVRCEAT